MLKAQFSENFAPLLPNAPGIYRYYDKGKQLLYVGKAKNLKKRISSYFTKTHDNKKTEILVSLIDQIEWTVTDDEHDAFLLENSLIKHFKPPFNISLKDDKGYPYVVIKNERFPRVFLTRNKIQDGSEYIGPFTDVTAVRELLQLIRSYIPLRTCGLNLSKRNIAQAKYKVCLEYHLGNCKGPCEGLQSEEAYMESIATVRSLLKGNLGPLLKQLKEEMQEHAQNLEFEKAQIIKKKLDSLQNYQSKSAVVSSTLHDVDAASIIMDGGTAFINYMIVKEGRVLHSKSLKLESQLEENPEDILAFAISFLRPRFQSDSKELVLPFKVQLIEKDVAITIPIKGDKKKLLDLSYKNAEYFKAASDKKGRLLLKDKTEDQRFTTLEQLQEDLHLPSLPVHIECFDNSNFQGSFPVAAMVCFKNGQPSKKDYRHFNIKTVKGINDYASMSEVVMRRYKRLLEENSLLPQLVIIDGGKGQLSAAMKSIEELGLTGSMTLISLAEREEEVFYVGDSESVKLPYNGDSLLFLRRIRDEVHRFAITFHRNQRSAGTFTNELETIPGIGQKTAQTLLRRYRSVSKIKQMTLRELTLTIGASKARIVYQHFHPEE